MKYAEAILSVKINSTLRPENLIEACQEDVGTLEAYPPFFRSIILLKTQEPLVVFTFLKPKRLEHLLGRQH
jgi:hypothetical protein